MKWLLIAAALWEPSQSAALTMQELVTGVERGTIRSVAEALGQLPPDARSRFVLMEKSRSLQEGSPDAPRALVFDEKARLVVSFNGRPGQRGYGTLEAIQWDPARLVYEMRRFDFTGAPTVSPPNPQACLVCHRSRPRPNWEPYPYWPGALGEGPRYSAPERDRLKAFAAANGKHPLYGQLRLNGAWTAGTTPAFELYARFTEQTLERAPALLTSSPDFPRYRAAIAAALADCPELESAPRWPELKREMGRRYQRLPSPYQALLRPAIASVTAKLRLVLEPRFSVDLIPNSFTDRYFLTAAGALVPQLLARLPAVAPVPWAALRGYFNPSQPYGPAERRAHGDYCASLKKEFP